MDSNRGSSTAMASNGNPKRSKYTLSLAWMLTQIGLVAVAIACLMGVDLHRIYGPNTADTFLPCGFALCGCLAIGRCFGRIWAGLIVGGVLAGTWLVLLWHAAASGAFS